MRSEREAGGSSSSAAGTNATADSSTEVTDKAKQSKTPLPVTVNDVSALKLQRPPVPSEPLEQGWMEKLGANRENWKKRWFIASNEADNFTIYYYEKEQEQLDTAKFKGTINPCGYRVSRITDDDEKEKYGKFSLKLHPIWYSRRRTWYLSVESEEELEKWEGVLRFSCMRARPPMNPDPVMREAFKQAFTKTRFRLGVWGWYSFTLSEDEMLAQMIVDRCNRDIMSEVYSQCTGNRFFSSYKMRRQMESTLDSTVGSVVSAGWKAASQQISDTKPTIKGKAEENIGSILDKEQEVMNKISDGVSQAANPVVESSVAPVAKPLVEAMTNPLYNASKTAIEIFKEKMKEYIADGENLEKNLKYFDRRCKYSFGELREAFKCIHELTRYDSKTSVGNTNLKIPIGDVIEKLGDVSLWRVENRLEDIVRDLIQAAIYTYKIQVEEGAPNGEETLNDVLSKLVNDSKILGNLAMAELLYEVVGENVMKQVMPKLSEILEPVKGLIPEAFESLLDVDEMAQRIVYKIITGMLHAALDPTADPIFAQLDQYDPHAASKESSEATKKEEKPAPVVVQTTTSGAYETQESQDKETEAPEDVGEKQAEGEKSTAGDGEN